MNREEMDNSLKTTLIKEIGLPVNLSSEWRQLLEKESETHKRMQWLLKNILRLTFDEFSMMYETLIMYRLLEEDQTVSLEAMMNTDLTPQVLSIYFETIAFHLEGDSACDLL